MSYDYAARRPYASPITLGGYRSADRETAPAASANNMTAADALQFLTTHGGYDDPTPSPKHSATMPCAAAATAAPLSTRDHLADPAHPLTSRKRPLSCTAGRRLPALQAGGASAGACVTRSVDGGADVDMRAKAPGFLTQHAAHDGCHTETGAGSRAPIALHPQKPDSPLKRDVTTAPTVAELANPIERNPETHYHTSQQNALNAQLRGEVEQLLDDWIARLAKLQSLMEGYPKDCALTNFGTTEALKSYHEMYRCTDAPALTRDELTARHNLETTREDLVTVESLPALSLEGVQRALDNLLNAKELLSHSLDDHHRALLSLDAFAGKELVLPSATAVALHERHHYDPGEYALLALRQSQEPLDKMEERVETARIQKERAIDAKQPGVALGNLHAQADYSNDLLLLNKARMAVVKQHEDDIREYRIDVTQLLKDAKEACEAFRLHVTPYAPKLNHDVRALQDGTEAARATLADLEETECREEAKSRGMILEVDAAEKELWNEVREKLRQLHALAEKKEKLVKDRLSCRELRGREFAAVEQLLKAQEEELERQLQAHDTVHRWIKASDLYTAYVEAYVPKLLMDVNDAESAHEALAAKESEAYVRRYEMFTYAAEEARAKRSVQLDRMRLTERTLTHNLGVAPEVMDPNVEGTERRLGQVKEEAEEAKAYVEYMVKLEDDRRAEVEPYLERLVSRVVASDETRVHATPSITAALGAPTKKAKARTAAADGAMDVDVDVFRSASPSNTRALALYPDKTEGGCTAVAEDVPAMMVTHPHVAARNVGLKHEAKHLEKHRLLVQKEMDAVDSQKNGVRRSEKQLAALAAKYKNADEIRALLKI